MSNEQLKHIFDNSVCLTRRQMKDYVNGTMTNEESHAVELHLNSCPFCDEAIEGLFEQKEGNAVEVLAELDTEFLKDHFSLHHPHIHLNSLTSSQPAVATAHYPHKRKNTQPFWRNISIAAALLLGVSIFWYMKEGSPTAQQSILAQSQQSTQQTTGTPAVTKYTRDKIADNTLKTKEPQRTSEAKLSEPQTTPPANNGSGPQSPQTLLLADKPAEKKESADTQAEPRQKEQENVATTNSLPISEKMVAAPKPPVAAGQIEKMPTRSVNDIAATSGEGEAFNTTSKAVKVTGTRTQGDNYYIDGVAVKTDNLDKAENLYNQKKYKEALNTYKKELNSGDKSRRQKASLMTARCYLALGQKAQATKVLEDLVQNGSGAAKREARKMLGDLQEK